MTPDGYTRRNWGWLPHFVNINIDEFRKILDGTVRILSREEVVDRTKICLQNDLSRGTFDDYLTPATLFDGLYRSENDRDRADGVYNNSWLENKWWMKTSGRYPTIPQVYDLLDDTARKLQVVKVSEYDRLWPTVEAKVDYLNELFPQEYTGDIYAAHAENTWMTYNPYQYEDQNANGVRTRHISTRRASGRIPFLYNTAEAISLDFCPYGMAVMKEFPDSVMLYMSNYRNSKTSNDNGGTFLEDANVADTVRIYGATETPVVTWFDRADHRASEVEQKWENGVLTLVVCHNGPVEIGIKCAGAAAGRKTEWTRARIEVPEAPSVYTGTLQYEAEFFDYKNVGACRGNAYYDGHWGYQGQGYMEMGTNRSASIRDTVSVWRDGVYTVTVRYQAPQTVRLQMSVNGKRSFLTLRNTDEQWAEVSAEAEMNAGANELELKFATAAVNVLIDCVKINSGNAQVYDFESDAVAASPAMVTLCEGEAAVAAADGGHVLRSASAGEAVLDLFPADGTDYGVAWRQVEGSAGVQLRGGYLFRTDGTKVAVCVGGKALAEGEAAEGMCYFRGILQGGNLYMDGSVDGQEWSSLLSVADATHAAGDTRLCWDGPMAVDDITLYRPGLTVSQTDLEDISMACGGADRVVRSVDLSGADLLGDVELVVDGGAFELSLDSLDGYAEALSIDGESLTDDGEPMRVFVRLKPDLPVGGCAGTLTIRTKYLETRTVNLKGNVTPGTYTVAYDFEDDELSSGGKNPPAAGITCGVGNQTSAGGGIM